MDCSDSVSIRDLHETHLAGIMDLFVKPHTFPHGCVVEPLPQAHPPLYSSLAFFDKVQSDETLGSIQRDLETKPWKTVEKHEKTWQMVKNRVSSFGTKKKAVDHKNGKSFFDLCLSVLPMAFSVTCCLEWFRAFNETRSFAISHVSFLVFFGAGTAYPNLDLTFEEEMLFLEGERRRLTS